MKRFLYLIIGGCIMAAGCTKNNDSVKASLENALPAVEVTSLGLMNQVGPFAQSDAISVTFGGALTKTEAGAFDIAWYDAPTTGAATRVDSVHFDSWNVAAATATANNAITTTFIGTSYANTNAFSGNLVLKLAKLPSGSKSYTLRVYARTKDNQMASVSVSKMITVK
ncbi:MAG: hypothetical protein QM731_13180 [Chitinophagaceae bacterium]